MSTSVPSRFAPQPLYGWSADGKNSAEISSDIRQTRYRLESDIRALRAKLTPRQLIPAVIATGVMAGLSYLIRRIRRRRR